MTLKESKILITINSSNVDAEGFFNGEFKEVEGGVFVDYGILDITAKRSHNSVELHFETSNIPDTLIPEPIPFVSEKLDFNNDSVGNIILNASKKQLRFKTANLSTHNIILEIVRL
jgi:hypothetical protein